jgi:hypothetical protein
MRVCAPFFIIAGKNIFSHNYKNRRFVAFLSGLTEGRFLSGENGV